MNFSMRLKIIAIVAPVIPVLIASFVLLQTAQQQSEGLRSWINHTYEVTRHITMLLADIQDLEAGQWGFVITNDESFLEPYNRSIKKVDSDLDDLHSMLSQLPRQQGLESLIRKKIDEMSRTILIRRELGLTAAAEVISQKTGKNLMNNIRRIMEAMIEEENRLLAQRKTEFEQAAADQKKIELIAVAGLLLTYFIMTLLLMRSVLKPLRTLTKSAAALAEGDDTARLAFTRNDEFGELAGAFNRMAEAIQTRTLQLKNNEARLRSIIDTAASGIITINSTGMVETMNPGAEQIFGYPRDEVIGRNITMLMPEPYVSRHDDYLRNYLSTGHANIIGMGREVEGKRKSGDVFPLELFVSEMTIDGSRMFTGLLRDITERRKTETLKNEFISTVSHELRTPLTSIRGSLGLILGGATGELPEQSKHLLSIASNNCLRLVRLINDILDIEKLESGKMAFDLKPLAIMPLVRQSLDSNQAYADEFGVTFAVTGEAPGVCVLADSDRLIQVLTNLLSNAAKFSPRGGRVEVSVSTIGPRLRLTVTDHGPGINEEFRSRIFKKFSQEDTSNTRQKGGTGLGLNICKAIVEKLDGEIGLINEANKGACFYVDLPVWHETPAPTTSDNPGYAQKQVLILEDNPDVANLLRLMLEKHGYPADIAYDAEQAKQWLNIKHYDALTLDLMLPRQSGVDFFRELRALEQFHDLPVIVVSAVADKGRQELNGEALQVIDWLDKPIDEDRLLRAVAQALRKKNKAARILHVEDDLDIAHLVGALLHNVAEVEHAPDLATAREKLQQDLDLVILDITLPDGSGLSLLPLLSQHCDIPVVIFSASEMDLSCMPQITANLVKSKTTDEMVIKKITSILDKRN